MKLLLNIWLSRHGRILEPVYMEWGTPVKWGWFLLFSRSGGQKTKETYPTKPRCPTPCKQGLKLPILCFHSRGQHLCKFIGTEESVYIRKEFNSHRTCLGPKHGPAPFGTQIWPPWRHVKTHNYLQYIVTSEKQNILGANWIAPADSIPNVFSTHR